MNPIFSIKTEDIQSLNDVQSRELVARLCRAELRKLDVSEGFVLWGGDQRANDGGVDVLVDIDPPLGVAGYIKSDKTIFQVKAESFNKAKIPGEMAPKGSLRPAIRNLVECFGTYIIVSTRDNLANSAYLDRINAMKACLSDHGITKNIKVDFYDCRKIADWIEQCPSIVIWLKYIIGKPLAGWRGYGPWAYKETDLEEEFLVDDKTKVVIPDSEEDVDILSGINLLRQELSRKVSIRIVGLSGVGKTRFVQALFDQRIITRQPALSPDNVVYTDISDNPSPQPTALIDFVVSSLSDCIIIVDNCGSTLHQKLTERIACCSSEIKLITIEYDIRDNLPEGTKCYHLEGSSDDLIKKLVKRRFSFLSENDLQKIAEFSAGNARVAFSLASTTENNGELARLRDDELFKRLFLQKNTENDELLKCAEIASLLYSFNGETGSEKSEMSLLASLAEVPLLSFSRNISLLSQRGLVQKRGKWRAVLPHAISNRLASQAIDVIPCEYLVENLVDNATDRIARSFSRRLGFLHESRSAQDIVQEWLQINGKYSDLVDLNNLGKDIFSNIAPVNPNCALEALERAVLNKKFVSIDNKNRCAFAHIARSLAYDRDLFDRAAKILIEFALAENEEINYDSCKNILKSLFYYCLSGTLAEPIDRAKIIQELIASNVNKKHEIALALLEASLETMYFSSCYSFDFGARKRGYGWWPKTKGDIISWYGIFFDLAFDVCKENCSPIARDVRAILGRSLRGILLKIELADKICMAAEELAGYDGWPEAWISIKYILKYDKDKINEKTLGKVCLIEKILAPKHLKAKICGIVLTKGYLAECFEDEEDCIEKSDNSSCKTGHRSRAESESEKLGVEVVHQVEVLKELLPDIFLTNSNSKVWHFGFGVGKEIKNHLELILDIKETLMSLDSKKVSFIFLRGFVSAWYSKNSSEVNNFFDQAVNDEIFGERFPELQVQVKLDELAVTRLLLSLELNRSSIWQYQYLAWGRVTDSLSVESVFVLLNKIVSSREKESLFIAFDLLSMVIHCTDNKDSVYIRKLVNSSSLFLQSVDWSKAGHGINRFDHDIKNIFNFIFTKAKFEDGVDKMLHNIILFEKNNIPTCNSRIFVPFFKFYPKESLDKIYKADGEKSLRESVYLISNIYSDLGETAIEHVADDILLEWCKESPAERSVFAIYACKIFDKNDDTVLGNFDDLSISAIAVNIMLESIDKKNIVKIFISRLYPSVWSGNLSVVLRKRLTALQNIGDIHDITLQEELQNAIGKLKRDISLEETREETEERQHSESFE